MRDCIPRRVVDRTEEGRVLAIDSGKVRTGLALSDELRVLASPYGIIEATDRMRVVREICQICAERDVRHILVGLPLHMTGEAGVSARRATDLAQRVADATGLDVELVDERLTTVEAKRKSAEGGKKKKSRAEQGIDAVAAAVLLQAWLDAR